MGKRNGKKNDASKSNNSGKSNKRRVSFNLSSEHTHRHSYNSVANSNDSTNNNSYQQRTPTRPRQTWLQTLLLSGALILTLPKLLHRAAHVYCSKEIDKQYHNQHAHNNFLEDKPICRIAKAAIGRYERHVPYSHYLLGINNDLTDSANDPILHQDTDQPSPRKEVDAKKKGIFKRVVDRHRQQRAEKKERQRSGLSSYNQHPLHHLLEGASAFSHWKKQQQKKQHQQPERTENKTIQVDWSKWKYAMSDDFQLTSQQTNLIQQLAKRVFLKSKLHKSMSAPPEDDDKSNTVVAVSTKSFQERVDSVPWGGVNSEVTKWWPRKKIKKDRDYDEVSSQSEGARLLAAYLKIMKWPKDLFVKFPFKLCPKGCDSEVSILHTLEWREKYMPWCTSLNAIQYNKAGFVYHRGHSRAGPNQRKEAERTQDTAHLSNVGHTMVWYSPAKASLTDPELYIRTLIYTLEAAVTDSLLRNDGEIGRFNLVLDCEGVGAKSIPSMSYVKKLFAFLQDHFPDRLGVLLLANLSGVGRMVMNMVLPFVTEEVKAKIHVIPAGQEKREEMFMQFIDLEQVPTVFGGKDNYVFDINEYYRGSIGGREKCVLEEDEIREYITTMPYHA